MIVIFHPLVVSNSCLSLYVCTNYESVLSKLTTRIHIQILFKKMCVISIIYYSSEISNSILFALYNWTAMYSYRNSCILPGITSIYRQVVCLQSCEDITNTLTHQRIKKTKHSVCKNNIFVNKDYWIWWTCEHYETIKFRTVNNSVKMCKQCVCNIKIV